MLAVELGLVVAPDLAHREDPLAHDVVALARLDARLWGFLVGTAFVGIAMGHVLYYRGIHRLGPVVASGVLLGTPFITMTGAWLGLGERMTTLELIGGLGVVAGGAFLVWAKSQIERHA